MKLIYSEEEARKLIARNHGLNAHEVEIVKDLPPPPLTSFGHRIIDLLRSQKKLEAIKEWRERFGIGLKEAKDEVDQLATLSWAKVKEAINRAEAESKIE